MDVVSANIKEQTAKVLQSMRTELSGQLRGNNIRVVDPAEVPKSPSKPNKRRALLLASLFGLLGGFFLALGVEALDQSIRSQEDVERKLGLPFLGSVPHAVFQGDSVKAYTDLIGGPESFTGESLKNIRTMIGFAMAGKDSKSLLLTSTHQGEGKTFMAISLAVVFAQLGEKVLIIEGDLRRPNLHKRFAVPNETGISHFLAYGKDASELPALVQPTGIPNLDVLPCGTIPPNPSELLSTPRMPALLEWARERFDRIIIDGTPVFPITDALLWGRHAGTAVFVVKFGGPHSALAVRARQKLEDGGLKIAGAVINQVSSRGGHYGGYYYYYRYHYHYKYSDYAKKA
jgi:capsular exopolysaccharide synthesis family protein